MAVTFTRNGKTYTYALRQVLIQEELSERLRAVSAQTGIKIQMLASQAIAKYLDELEAKE